ncbi:MAG: hypothetical protein WCF18_03650 [Chthoniobacteraceae bacterium]
MRGISSGLNTSSEGRGTTPSLRRRADSTTTSTAASATVEQLTLGYASPVLATGVRETNGNGFVTRIDLLDTDNQFHTVFSGVDPSPKGTVVDLLGGALRIRSRAGRGFADLALLHARWSASSAESGSSLKIRRWIASTTSAGACAN